MKILYWLITIWLISQTVWADEAAIVTEVSVQTGKISQTTLRRYVMGYGLVEPEPATASKAAASSKIAASVAGIIQQNYCVEGQGVDKGQLLFELDTRSVDALIAKAQVAVEFAQKNFARKQQLNATENISRKLYDDAEQVLQTARQDLLAAKTQRELLKITAPLAGTITACHVKAGEAVSLNAMVAEVIDLHRLNIIIHVPSIEAIALRLKQPVMLKANSDILGKITFISAQVDPLTDTVLVRASLASDANLRAGQLVNVSIVVEQRDCLAVPVESVVKQEQNATIAIVEGDHARQQAVKLGLRDGNLIEIQGEGLQEGMTIVTKGSYGLPPDTRIRVVK
ncbi:MAG: efflux RND transporter periplasmic adaptor subunit [Methylococcales bacterium]|nr:efflux RND transporter periplasmic adaptor subunit [Methylococcales bacterium]